MQHKYVNAKFISNIIGLRQYDGLRSLTDFFFFMCKNFKVNV